ncbi:MAG: DUF4832 domain-containing protein, partial [Pseudomonadota bacterium]
CSDSYNPQNNCDNLGGSILAEMESLHLSYLNTDYNNDVNNDWHVGGCIDDIKNRMGYRFVLKQSTLPEEWIHGEAKTVELVVENSGFAAAINRRSLFLVFDSINSEDVYTVPLSGEHTNPQHWVPGEEVNVIARPVLPVSVPAGDYTLKLHIADLSAGERIRSRPEYSVQLANVDLWDADTGFNDLQHTVTVSEAGCDILCLLPAILSGSGQLRL